MVRIIANAVVVLLLTGCGAATPSQGDGGADQQQADAAPNCTENADCDAGFVCAGPGEPYCQEAIDNGSPSARDDRCASGIRTLEGICCDRRCDAPCETCAGLPRCTRRAEGAPCAGKGSCQEDPQSGLSAFTGPRCDGKTASCEGAEESETCQGVRCDNDGCLTRCERHHDCVSGICERWSDLPEERGRCIDEALICYVDAQAAPNGDGSRPKPFATINACLDIKAAHVVVALGSYAEDLPLTYDVTIVGRGAGTLRDAEGHVRPRATVGVMDKGVVFGAERVYRLAGLGLTRHPTGNARSVIGKTASSMAASLDIEELLIRDGGSPIRLQAERVHISGLEADGTTLSIGGAGSRSVLRHALIHRGIQTLFILGRGAEAELHDISVSLSEGAMHIGDDVRFRASKITVDTSYYPGLTVGEEAKGTITNVLVNTGIGGGIAIRDEAEVDLIHVTLLASKWQDSHFLSCSPTSKTRVINSIVWSAGTYDIGADDCTFINSIYGKGSESDPRLDEKTYVPSLGSAAIDAAADAITGVTLPAVDFAGNPRRVMLFADSPSRGDLGAFERQP